MNRTASRVLCGSVGAALVGRMVGGWWTLIVLQGRIPEAQEAEALRHAVLAGTVAACLAGGAAGCMLRRNPDLTLWTLAVAIVAAVATGIAGATMGTYALAIMTMGGSDDSFAVYGGGVVGWMAAALGALLAVLVMTRRTPGAGGSAFVQKGGHR